jgi:hypothetical protein
VATVRIVYWLATFVFFGMMLAVALRMKPKPPPTRPPAATAAPVPSTVELPREPPFGPLKLPDSELPCDVDQVLADKCRRCHGSPARHGAPLTFYKWSELHAEYLGEPVYKRLGRAVETGFMPNRIPANPPVEPLSPDEKRTLAAWVAAGAPRGSCAPKEASANVETRTKKKASKGKPVPRASASAAR